MDKAHDVLSKLAFELGSKVKAESAVPAHFSTQLLIDVSTLLQAVNQGRLIPPPDLERLVALRNEIAHTTITTSAALAPFHQTLTDIARKVA